MRIYEKRLKLLKFTSTIHLNSLLSYLERESGFRNSKWEYQKSSLASLEVSVLDRPHFKLENLLRRFIRESSPDDAGYKRSNNLRSNTVRLITTNSYSSFRVTLLAPGFKKDHNAQIKDLPQPKEEEEE
ncbi:hypothetical protein Tco_0312846, partial [Tanacetum coccineum]